MSFVPTSEDQNYVTTDKGTSVCSAPWRHLFHYTDTQKVEESDTTRDEKPYESMSRVVSGGVVSGLIVFFLNCFAFGICINTNMYVISQASFTVKENYENCVTKCVFFCSTWKNCLFNNLRTISDDNRLKMQPSNYRSKKKRVGSKFGNKTKGFKESTPSDWCVQ